MSHLRSIVVTVAGVLVACGVAWFVLLRGHGADPLPPEEKLESVTNSIGMKLVKLPPGRFLMGSPTTEKERGEDEFQHEVVLTKPFWMAAFETTQAQYQKVMGVNPSWFTPEGGGKARLKGRDTANYPVDSVTWQQAVEFCKKLSDLPEEKKAGRVYRLPTEAEWEYACRAGTRTVFHYGDTLDSYQANFNGLSTYGGRPSPYLRHTTLVGDHLPNRFGLFDMHGNVQEWCSDWYAANYYKVSPKADPTGPKEGSERILRGGCWIHSGKACRAAVRNKLPPDEANYGVGFRVVVDAKS